MKEKIEELASMINNSKDTVIMTGAGMDTESNIPDFRSKDGWWEKRDPKVVASIETMAENYSLFHEFYSYRIKTLEKVAPHKGHYILADLEKKGLIKSIATQNVSGLHREAGSENVYELHGNIRKIRCNSCNQNSKIDDFLEKRSCSYCNKEALRPGVVLFGEALPSEAWNKAIEDIKSSDLLIVIGTSLEVYPVNQFPNMTRGKTVYTNMEESMGYDFDLEIIGKAGEILIELEKVLE